MVIGPAIRLGSRAAARSAALTDLRRILANVILTLQVTAAMNVTEGSRSQLGRVIVNDGQPPCMTNASVALTPWYLDLQPKGLLGPLSDRTPKF